MQDDDVFVIFPEGKNWTPGRRAGYIRRLRERGDLARARRAEQLHNVLPPQDPGCLGGPGGAPRGRRHGARPRRPRPALDPADDLGGAAVRRPAVPRQDLDVCRGHRAARGRGVRARGSTSGGARSTPGSSRTPHRTCPGTSPAPTRSRSDEGRHARSWWWVVSWRSSPRAPSRPRSPVVLGTTTGQRLGAGRRPAPARPTSWLVINDVVGSGAVVLGTVRLDFTDDGRVTAADRLQRRARPGVGRGQRARRRPADRRPGWRASRP